MNDAEHIEVALAAWQAEQRLRGGYTQIELDELVDHVRSSATELTPTAAERVQLAAHRVGADAELAREFERVRGVRFEALAFSPAGLLTAGALLWVFAGYLISGTKFGVMTALLWAFPRATDFAHLVGSIVSLGVVALLATLLASERRARAIAEQLRAHPWRLLGACSGIAIVAVAVNIIGRMLLLRVADVRTMENAEGFFMDFLPLAGYTSWIAVPLVLFWASRRAARRTASFTATEQAG
jgi:hypothetical protein